MRSALKVRKNPEPKRLKELIASEKRTQSGDLVLGGGKIRNLIRAHVDSKQSYRHKDTPQRIKKYNPRVGKSYDEKLNKYLKTVADCVSKFANLRRENRKGGIVSEEDVKFGGNVKDLLLGFDNVIFLKRY